MRRSLPRPQAGDYLTADLLNALYREIERLDLTVGANLILNKGRGGMSLAAICPDRLWIKVTGAAVTLSSGAKIYPWTEQIPISGGTWVAGDQTGTAALDSGGAPTGDPAVESNKNGSVPLNSIVMAMREDGVLGFTFRKCS